MIRDDKRSEERRSEIVKGLQAISHKYRFRILRMLEIGPLSSYVIQQVLDLRILELRKHLDILRAACLISEFKDGAQVLYCLNRKPDRRYFYFLLLSWVRKWHNWNPLIKRDKVKVRIYAKK